MKKLKFFFFLLSALLVSGNVWSDTSDFLCFTAQQAGSKVTLKVAGNAPTKTYLHYSYDCTHWSNCNMNSTGATFTRTLSNVGDKIYFTAAAFDARTGSFACHPAEAHYTKFSLDTTKYWHFVIEGAVAVSGNIMSLYTNSPTTTVPAYCFCYLFKDCTGLVDASELIMPATTLSEGCYRGMFEGCTNLVSAPELPATTLAKNCYQDMFKGCTSLTDAPALPATNLADYCYYGMFYDCSSLETAPTLAAQRLTTGCYNYMFTNCTNLNYIECLATSKLGWTSTYNWLSGVTASGTFVTSPDASSTFWQTNVHSIPAGWTVTNDPITPTDIESLVESPISAISKIMLNGRLFILRNNQMFDMNGYLVK